MSPSRNLPLTSQSSQRPRPRDQYTDPNSQDSRPRPPREPAADRYGAEVRSRYRSTNYPYAYPDRGNRDRGGRYNTEAQIDTTLKNHESKLQELSAQLKEVTERLEYLEARDTAMTEREVITAVYAALGFNSKGTLTRMEFFRRLSALPDSVRKSISI
jgi:hypothetical protein